MNAYLKNAAFAAMFFTLSGGAVQAQRAIFVDEGVQQNEFQLRNSEIPQWEIIPGGPGKDGIPAISSPQFVDARHDQWLDEDAMVVGLEIDGVAKAYPVKILNYHEVVNDKINDKPVAITYSPLCGSAMAFSTKGSQGEQWEMAVSGLLHNNNTLFFDRQTESLWSQVLGRAVAGPVAGAQMELLPMTLTTWADWKEKHPATMLLSKQTGFNRNYDLDTYAYYQSNDRLMFPVNHIDKRLPAKTRVIGIAVDGAFKAYAYNVLAQLEEGTVVADEINGQPVRISYNGAAKAAYATDANGQPLPVANLYWFAWSAFHPDTQLHGVPAEGFPASLSTGIGML